MSSGFMLPIYSLFHLVSQTMPISATPTPACANTVPQVERGNPRARRIAVAEGRRNRPVRSTRSLNAPAMTKIASPMASGAKAPPPRVHAHSTATAINDATPAAVRRCAAPSRSPRFHASNGPNGTAIISGTNSGAKGRLKNGAPTEILRSEERRVGKSVDLGGRRIIKKKKKQKKTTNMYQNNKGHF